MVALLLDCQTCPGGFEAVDDQLEDAARVLGRSAMAVFCRVTLPSGLARGIPAGILLGFARSLGEFWCHADGGGHSGRNPKPCRWLCMRPCRQGTILANTLVPGSSDGVCAGLADGQPFGPGASGVSTGAVMSHVSPLLDVQIQKNTAPDQREFALDIQLQSDARRVVIHGPSGAARAPRSSSSPGLITRLGLDLGGGSAGSMPPAKPGCLRKVARWAICFKTMPCSLYISPCGRTLPLV